MRLLPVLAVRDVVSLVNGYAGAPRVAAGEQDSPYPGVEHLPGELARRPLAQLVGVADDAYRVFAAAPDATAAAAATAVLNGMLRSASPLPVATEGGTRFSVRYARQVLPGALAVCLLGWIDRYGSGRLGLCHGTRCTDVFADASPAGVRRFCSATCLNRHKVAAYRDRVRRLPNAGRA